MNKCYLCKHYRDLRIKRKGKIIHRSCCVLLAQEVDGWVQEVKWNNICEMFTGDKEVWKRLSV